ncbi:hypothetical protein [Bacillus sp. RAR_GA_16]|uniref:hypothetical protein n=1 Tax=Bacillus sp. RAR_GA_16 TaxID=2876774 RepID=UPI001CCD06A4|nr:hypothetical protein [Bacillus sp. RAR_GA_16]MCA0174579.1 hypothetical protein [Bacillus sp. RAR_GA_16]
MPYQPYIYHGSNWTFKKDGQTATIRNGEILFYQTTLSTLRAKFLMWDGKWENIEPYIQNSSTPNLDTRYKLYTEESGESPGFIQHITSFNCDQYGLCAYGGSKYTNIRHDASYYENGTTYKGTIPAGSSLAIGSKQGYTYGFDQSLIRIYGFWFPNGKWQETYGAFARCWADRAVENTTLNTF